MNIDLSVISIFGVITILIYHSFIYWKKVDLKLTVIYMLLSKGHITRNFIGHYGLLSF
jgi:hypothetical protein